MSRIKSPTTDGGVVIGEPGGEEGRDPPGMGIGTTRWNRIPFCQNRRGDDAGFDDHHANVERTHFLGEALA